MKIYPSGTGCLCNLFWKEEGEGRNLLSSLHVECSEPAEGEKRDARAQKVILGPASKGLTAHLLTLCWLAMPSCQGSRQPSPAVPRRKRSQLCGALSSGGSGWGLSQASLHLSVLLTRKQEGGAWDSPAWVCYSPGSRRVAPETPLGTLTPAIPNGLGVSHLPAAPLAVDSFSVTVLIGTCVLLAQSCLTLCDPMDSSPQGSSVHGILQARILEWVAIPFSRGSSQPRDQPQVSCIAGRFFTVWASREVQFIYSAVLVSGV